MLTWYLGVILKEVGTNLDITLPIALSPFQYQYETF